MLTSAIVLVATISIQSPGWPQESGPLPIDAIDGAPLREETDGTARVYRKDNLRVALFDGKSARDGLSAVYAAVPPIGAFHSLEQERRMHHPSVATLVMTNTRISAERTYATARNALSITVTLYKDVAAATAEGDPTRLRPGISARTSWRSPALAIGDESWAPMDDMGVVVVRDGRVVIEVSARAPTGVSWLKYSGAIIQAVRFRLMVGSGLIPGGQEVQIRTRSGEVLPCRRLDSTIMASVTALQRLGVTSHFALDGDVRTCRLDWSSRSIQLREYDLSARIDQGIAELPVAPFAYNEDLWIPINPVLVALGLD